MYSSAVVIDAAFRRLPGLSAAMVTRAPLVQFVPYRNLVGYGAAEGWLDPTDYTLASQFFDALALRWGPFQIEAFATPANARLFEFYTRMPHPASAGVNAFSQHPRRRVYANPPFILIGPWLQHCRELSIDCVVIVPQWDSGDHAAIWWPVLAFSQAPRLLLAPAGTSAVFSCPTGANEAPVLQPPVPWAIWAFHLIPGTY
jgi:hypothetical protein